MSYRQVVDEFRHNKKFGYIIISMTLGSYAFGLVGELDDPEPFPDYMNLQQKYMSCNWTSFPANDISRSMVKEWANCFSFWALGNDRIIPMLSSIGIVFLTYLLAVSISKDRIVGYIAMFGISHNPLLTAWDTTPTYDQLWALFFALSMVLLYRKSVLSPLSFILSIGAKIMAVGFLPAYILNIILDNIKHKLVMLLLVGILSGVAISFALTIGIGNSITLHPERLLDGFVNIFSSLWVVFVPIVGFILIDRFFPAKVEGKRIVYVWMGWLLAMTPLIYLFSGQDQYTYRFVPFGVYLSIYGGLVLKQLGTWYIDRKLGMGRINLFNNQKP